MCICDAFVLQQPELKQTRHRVEGYVIDEETEKPLPDTWIHYWDNAGAATDSTGHFILWLPKTDVELKASHIGYVSCVIKTVKPMLTIRLRSATKIREVKVSPKHPELEFEEWPEG